jgi:putative phosphoribosyl transferase
MPELDPRARDSLERALQSASDARVLLLVAHPDEASWGQPGHAFVADVLRANGFATLPFCLKTPSESAAGARPPGMRRSQQRIIAVSDWLAQQPALAGRPVALLGLGEAVRPCIAAAARQRPAVLRALLLLDGRADQLPHHLLKLNLPTLFVRGRCDTRCLARHSAALRDMPAGHRLEMLHLPTEPQPAPGALEAFACMARAWLETTLLRPGPSMHGGGAGLTAALAQASVSQRNPELI